MQWIKNGNMTNINPFKSVITLNTSGLKSQMVRVDEMTTSISTNFLKDTHYQNS